MDLCIALSDVVADYVTIVLSFLDNLAKKHDFIYVAVVLTFQINHYHYHSSKVVKLRKRF